MLEVLLVLALSFVGLFGLTSILIVAQRATVTARNLSEATALAQDKLEQMTHVPIASLVSGIESGIGPQGVAVAGGQYNRVTTVTAVGVLTTVQVQVNWRDSYNRPHVISVSTQRAP
jgi:hypothetical protein